MKRSPVLESGAVRAVTVGELNRHTSRTVASVADGERLIVTRHGDPVAAVLSLRDAIELLVTPALPALADSAQHDYTRADLFEPWPAVEQCRIVLARAATELYHRIGPRDRGGLRRALGRWDPDAECPLWLPTDRWLAPFSHPDEAVALVHAFIDARTLERELIGEGVWHARLRRDLDRHTHARTPWQR